LDKPKRIIDKKLIKHLKDNPCNICGKPGPSDVHHLTTRGAGGNDTLENLLVLCRKHHVEIHQVGLTKFSWKYPKFKEWLTKHKRFDLLNKIH